jgi:hypothetical protein
VLAAQKAGSLTWPHLRFNPGGTKIACLDHTRVKVWDVASGELIEVGKVAVKIKAPDGKAESPLELLNMQDGFGADVDLAEKGVYQLQVGTELNDGKKRVFLFRFRNQ